LNAYVDGDLPESVAAWVAEAAGFGAAVSASLALIYHLKGSMRSAMPRAPGGLASPIPISVRPTPMRYWLAAAVAVAAVVALGALFQAFRADGTTTAQMARTEIFVDEARLLHDDWLARDTDQSAKLSPATMGTLARYRRLPVVPDMESSGLKIRLVQLLHAAGERILQICYRGHHGCHLSLFVTGDLFAWKHDGRTEGSAGAGPCLAGRGSELLAAGTRHGL